MIDARRIRTDILALALLAATAFVGASLFSYSPADPPTSTVYPASKQVANFCGSAGALTAHFLRSFFGHASWMLVAAMLLLDARLFSHRECKDPGLRMIGGICLVVAASFALQIVLPNLQGSPIIGNGGYVGAWGRMVMSEHVSIGGSLIIITTLLAVGLLLSADLVILRFLWTVATLPAWAVLWPLIGVPKDREDEEAASPAPTQPVVVEPKPVKTVRKLKPSRNELTQQPISVDAPLIVPGVDHLLPEMTIPLASDEPADEGSPQTMLVESKAQAAFKVNPPVRLSAASDLGRGKRAFDENYELPDWNILDGSEAFPFEELAARAQESAATLEQAFQQFGLNVKVAEIDTGPVVTQFELELEPGLRVSKVFALEDDLAIALRVPAVRVVSPIPGKNTVGIEVPNSTRVTVRLRELLQACGKETESMAIPIFVGKDVSGHPLAVDLAKMPHLLIAGRTGTGKSVCLNSLILSVLMTRSPRDVRMLMIDPKMVELSPYMNIPHLMHPVITDMKKAEAVLAWAVDKMEERYDLLAKTGVRHIDSYNRLGKEKVLDRMGIEADAEEAIDVPEHLPYIVIIADEMADMIMTSGKDVEGHIIRLAQKSRAVGIHLVLATQKPTVDVITGLIKSNLPARMSFQVASRTDSRVVLDENGAERLLGNGDMLYLAPGTSCLTRAQGTYVSDEEVQDVIEFFADQPPQYCAEIEEATKKALAAASASGSEESRERDEMYNQAVEVVIREGRGSVSLLQRALGVGYGRAARMVDNMAEDGIVGSYNGSKHREVLITQAQWEDLRDSDEATVRLAV
jgi:S-DNA-T family DNA segregation ATPase FtsK/SpoIIIE